MYELLHKLTPYPWKAKDAVVERPVRRSDDIVCFRLLTHYAQVREADRQSRIRARNGLRILLDCSSSFGMVSGSQASQGVKSLPAVLKTSKEFH